LSRKCAGLFTDFPQPVDLDKKKFGPMFQQLSYI
jgi:hypothetical protein